MKIFENASLKSLNSFGVSAKTRYLVYLHEEEDVLRFLEQPKFQDIPTLILGSGSNILFHQDCPGVVAVVAMAGIHQHPTRKNLISAAAGENWHAFVQHTLGLGLSGLENLSLIPGTVGAAPIQNIGAYGVELAEYFTNLNAIDLQTGSKLEFDREACQFGYRNSFFKNQAKGRYLITNVSFELSKQLKPNLHYQGITAELARRNINAPSARNISDVVCAIRQNKLPDPKTIGNAGSFFQNPIISEHQYQNLQNNFPEIPGYLQVQQNLKVPAAWLIEQCGWKGFREGDAGVYRKHALVLVNYGTASGQDILNLALRIQASVEDKFGITLLPEPNIIPQI